MIFFQKVFITSQIVIFTSTFPASGLKQPSSSLPMSLRGCRPPWNAMTNLFIFLVFGSSLTPHSHASFKFPAESSSFVKSMTSKISSGQKGVLLTFTGRFEGKLKSLLPIFLILNRLTWSSLINKVIHAFILSLSLNIAASHIITYFKNPTT